jgi:hypothetical protein
VPNEQLPEPYQSIRALHRDYGRRINELDNAQLAEAERSRLGMVVWFETDARLKVLRKGLPKKQTCRATTRAGTPCSRLASPDYIGQLCSSHMPHVDDW